MKTILAPIRNMCGIDQGLARVTINALGNYVIDPIRNEKFGGLNYVTRSGGYVHHGISFVNKGNMTYVYPASKALSTECRIVSFFTGDI